LIDKIVGLAENLSPVALIGGGGIGKTSIALTVLHHDRIKRRFGEDRRFIRCDQFPATPAHFLTRLSTVTGAGVENPDGLALLYPFLCSKEMIIVLDNAESILDPWGTNDPGIYDIVEELSQLKTVCLCITSRISTAPPGCQTLNIPSLSVEAACDIFYRIYKHGGRSDLVNSIPRELYSHPYLIVLLVTTAHLNGWDTAQLSKEWKSRRGSAFQADCVAAVVEFSLASHMFQILGPDARELLGVVAFFPRGVDESNVDRLFPTITNRTHIFNRFRTFSLTYPSEGFITMLAPFRDYLCPRDPKSSPLLCLAKEYYFSRLSVDVNPGKPGFEESGWIISEDMNVERLLDVFTSADPDSTDVWDACCHFMEHLYWHRPRVVALGPKIEWLPDDHPSKPQSLFGLSRLFTSVGNYAESRRLQVHALELWRKRERDLDVAETLLSLSETSRQLNDSQGGMYQAKEAYQIFVRLDSADGQERSKRQLASL